MSFEIIDIFIISVVLLFSLIFVYKRAKNLLTNQDVNQCNSCGDKSCSSNEGSSNESSIENQSCQKNDNLK